MRPNSLRFLAAALALAGACAGADARAGLPVFCERGKDITAADLTAGDAVSVRYHEDGGKNVADIVMVRTTKKPADAAKTDVKK